MGEHRVNLVEALEIFKQVVPEGAHPLRAFLACGFTPLHLQTFLVAHLRKRLPQERIGVKTGLFGDLGGSINRLRKSECDILAVVIEAVFSQELYLAPLEIKEMIDGGMTFGLHGYSHNCMNTLDQKRQEREIVDSLRVLQPLGVNPLEWIMCYPYGANNDSSKPLLKRHNCKIVFCTEVRIAELGRDNIFALPRLDTNDSPKTRNAEPSSWFSAMFS